MEWDNFANQKFGLVDYLIDASENNINLSKDNHKDLFIIIEDLFEDNLINVNFLNYFLKEISLGNLTTNPDNQYIKLIDYPRILELIFKYIWDIPIFCFKLRERPTNLIMIFPYNNDNIQILNDFCSNAYWSYVIYDDNNKILPNCKKINLNVSNDSDTLVNFRKPNNAIFSINQNLPILQGLYGYHIYYIEFKNKSWINLNDNYENSNNIMRKLKNIKKWFRFKWFPLLLPIYIIDNNNVNEMTFYIWDKLNKYFRIRFNFQDIIELGLHPLQLIGSTTSICFRRKYLGNENIFENFNIIDINSVKMWNKISDKNIYEIIIQSLMWNYSYIGYFNCQKEFLEPLLHLRKNVLNILNYPYNIIVLTLLLDNKDFRIYNKDDIIRRTKEFIQGREEFIDKYISLI